MENEALGRDERYPVFYGIGLGPGDPGLVTLKALAVLRECRKIFVPDGGGPGGSRAFRILESLDASLPRKALRFPIPMGKVEPGLWRSMARKIISFLSPESPCGMAVEGDPLLYGSFIRLREEIQKLREDIKVEVVSGIPSFVAAAARLGLPLASGRESFCVLAGPLNSQQLENHLMENDTLVLLKARTCLGELGALLRSRAGELKAWLVEDCGTPHERVHLVEDGRVSGEWGYFTLAIVRKNVQDRGTLGGERG